MSTALASGNDDQRQLELLAASVSAIMIIFRAFLRLHGDAPPTDNVALSEAAARRASFDPAPFVTAVRHRRGEAPLKAADVRPVLTGYLRGMEQLVSHLDAFDAPDAATDSPSPA